MGQKKSTINNYFQSFASEDSGSTDSEDSDSQTTPFFSPFNSTTNSISFFSNFLTPLPNTSSTLFNQNPNFEKTPDFPEIWLYFTPFIFLFGIIGNILVILVMKRKRMRNTTTAVYLIALAVADTSALLTRIPPEFFSSLGVGTFSAINEWTCRNEKFWFYTFSDIAIWVLVLFTVDRFIAVCLPLYKRKICLPKRAILLCLLMCIVMIFKNFHVFFTRGKVYRNNGTLKSMCGRSAFVFEQYIRPWIAFTTITMFPFLIIIFSNVAIIVTLYKARNHMQPRKVIKENLSSHSKRSISSLARLTLTSISRSISVNSEKTNGITWKSASPKSMSQTTFMCLATSITFLICVSPSIILTLGRVYWIDKKGSAVPFGITRAINYQLSILNHAINFFLYCLTGQRFRKELKIMMREYGKKIKSCSRRRKYTPEPLAKQSRSHSLRRFSTDSQSESHTKKLEIIKETDDDSEIPK